MSYVAFEPVAGWLQLVRGGRAAPILVSESDYPGVRRVARDLAADLERVSGAAASVLSAPPAAAELVVLVGTLGKSPLADELVARVGLDLETVPGSWERWFRGVVAEPWPGVERALLILGSDKRGSIFGVYDLSEQLGVSPWFWWADVPVLRRSRVFVSPEPYRSREPEVKYRGIFLNDEAPALSGWAREAFGGMNQQFYARVFELLLRLKANTLWPAMWGNAFNEDDPGNPRLADEYGIVMGTSHHEPMLRAQKEWQRHGEGAWDYADNGEELRRFWGEGIQRNRAYESIVTLGMRGDGDMPMSEGENLDLLERIVKDQREILRQHAAAELERVPQVWALYKEVQAYYDRGMRVPEDVTLLYCDDNWSNLRRLPSPDERARSGGAGIYYHFDYVGGPRSYKWLNTVPIGKVWEQMQLAAAYGAVRLWIVNVGDLKPLEFPLEFFLRLAWAPSEMTLAHLAGYAERWAQREFGAEHAQEVAELVLGYTRINGRRKPELLEPDTYSLVHYREAEGVVQEYSDLEVRARRVHQALPSEARAAFYQLVLHPIAACANLHDLYFTVGKNRLYARQGRAATNALFERARALFRADTELARIYNEDLSAGKWRHLMDQTHIGYTYWQQPVHNALPAVTELALPPNAALGVAVEGSERAWPTDDPNQGAPLLPQLDVYEGASRYIDVFNRGLAPFAFRALASDPWLEVSPAAGQVELEVRLEVSVDFSRAPAGLTRAEVSIEGPGARVVVGVPVFNPSTPDPEQVVGFVESDGHISIEAVHYARAVNGDGVTWCAIPEHGRELSAVSALPASRARSAAGAEAAPRLEYDLHLFSSGLLHVELFVSPSLDCLPSRSLACALSFDDEQPELVDLLGDGSQQSWARAVADGVRRVTWQHTLVTPGAHVLKFWRVDPAVVLQKLVIHAGALRPSYLGPPESFSLVKGAGVDTGRAQPLLEPVFREHEEA